jgi:hypothetical protein
MSKEIPLSEFIRVRDSNDRYFYYNYIDNIGVEAICSMYNDTRKDIAFTDLFTNDKDISNCVNGIRGKILYFKNRIESNDFKKTKEKEILSNIKQLEYNLTLFGSSYDIFIRKMKILKILE